MPNLCLETTDLTYQFSRKELVLDRINLQVEEGRIYGFLGPNGAGKTTTLRLLLGLLEIQQGSISIFGGSMRKDRTGVLKRIGSLIESPSLYGHLTARENLRLLQVIYQCPRSRMEEVLKLVGLADAGNKKTSQFSLGMKQRLSIAMALLHQPSLLILDEPTNGLDPNSIVEVRELLRGLNRELGTTLLLSSHLLPEIEKLVTHIGIINKGKLIFQGTLDSLKSRQEASSKTSLMTSDNRAAGEMLSLSGIVPEHINGRIFIPVQSNKEVAGIVEQLVQSRIEVFEVYKVESDLEKIFMNLVND